MESIPYYYEAINRSALVVIPKKPFYDWIKSAGEDDSPAGELDDNNIYLIEEQESDEGFLKWIKKNYDKIFVNELNGWWTDEAKWPEKRTYKMFEDWFDVRAHSMLLDIEDEPIRKD